MNSELFEVLEIPFNIKTLQSELLQLIADKEPVLTGSGFGGWSVTSSNGSYKDGWLPTKLTFDAKEKRLSHI